MQVADFEEKRPKRPKSIVERSCFRLQLPFASFCQSRLDALWGNNDATTVIVTQRREQYTVIAFENEIEY
jgi:hypothetical protein